MVLRKEEIKNIKVLLNDNDFWSVWEWIGEVVLLSLKPNTYANHQTLSDNYLIEGFIHSLIPTAIKYNLYNINKYLINGIYREIDETELLRLTDHIKKSKIYFNVDINTDSDIKFGGRETLLINIENNTSDVL